MPTETLLLRVHASGRMGRGQLECDAYTTPRGGIESSPAIRPAVLCILSVGGAEDLVSDGRVVQLKADIIIQVGLAWIVPHISRRWLY